VQEGAGGMHGGFFGGGRQKFKIQISLIVPLSF
jgi:hypothetical protein